MITVYGNAEHCLWQHLHSVRHFPFAGEHGFIEALCGLKGTPVVSKNRAWVSQGDLQCGTSLLVTTLLCLFLGLHCG